MRITLSGGAEASDGSNEQGGSPHLSHLLSFFCVSVFLALHSPLRLVVQAAAERVFSCNSLSSAEV